LQYKKEKMASGEFLLLCVAFYNYFVLWVPKKQDSAAPEHGILFFRLFPALFLRKRCMVFFSFLISPKEIPLKISANICAIF